MHWTVDEFVGVIVTAGCIPFLLTLVETEPSCAKSSLQCLFDISSSQQAESLVTTNALPILLDIVKRHDPEGEPDENVLLAGKILSRLGDNISVPEDAVDKGSRYLFSSALH